MSRSESTTRTSIQRIPFHEDELYAIVDERTGKEYVLPKPMVDIFGLKWPAQFSKLKKNKLFSKGITKIDIPTAGGIQEAILLDRGLVHAWLLSIDASRVAPERQEKLLRYQQECAKVLDAYFSQGAAVNPRMNALANPWDMLIHMAEAGREQAAKIQALEDQQRAQMAETIKTQEIALTALRSQQWVSIRQHCAMYKLTSQIPESVQNDYGRWLRGYCAEKDIPVYKITTADRQWRDENTYPSQVIADTLPGWLMRRSGQPLLTILPTQGDGTVQEEGVPYTPRRRKVRV